MLTRRCTFRSKAVSLLSATFLVLGLTAAISVAPAGAHTGSSPATGGSQSHPWVTNGCTGVPDSIAGVFNFAHACQHHDGCYELHWSSRSGCDSTFLRDMKASCKAQHRRWYQAVQRNICYGLANTYYGGVRLFGGSFYDAGTGPVITT